MTPEARRGIKDLAAPEIMQIRREYYPIEDAAKMVGCSVNDLIHLGANRKFPIWVTFDRNVRAWVEKSQKNNHEHVLVTLAVGLYELNPLELEYLEGGRKDWLSVVRLKDTFYRLIADGLNVPLPKMFIMTADIEKLLRGESAPPPSDTKQEAGLRRSGGVTVTLPHMNKALEAVFKVMWENWKDPDPKRLPKQINIARELDAALGYKPEKDDTPSRNAKAIATIIKPDAFKGTE